MTESEAWDELERKQHKKPRQFTQRMALQIAYNALSAIDKETPYPIAKHALMCINGVLSSPEQDWEAIAADQAMTIALAQSEKWDTSDMAYRQNGLAIDDDDIQDYKKPWVGLTDDEVHEAAIKCVKSGQAVNVAIRAIETKLKERNNG